MENPSIDTLMLLASQGKLPDHKLTKADLEPERKVSSGRSKEDPKTKKRNKIAKASRKHNRRKR